MESLISNLFATIVMEDLETECLSVLKNTYNCIPKKYYRYVDDIFSIVDKKVVEIILNIFNNYDPRLKFTQKIESNNSISFLNV